VRAYDSLVRYGQIGHMFGVAMFYHGCKTAGNLVDGEEGVLEQRVSQLFGQSVLRRLDMTVAVHGEDNVPARGRYCVVSNHSSYLDFAVLLAFFPSPLRIIAKKELTYMPGVGSYLKRRGVLIDRKRGVDAKQAIRNAATDEKPWPILLFAEGTRSKDGKVQPFKRGGLKILAEAGLPMVPVGITGTHAAHARTDPYIKTGHHLDMHIGEPVLPKELGVEPSMAEIERRVRTLVEG